MQRYIRRLKNRLAVRPVGIALLCVTVCGCASFWDELTSRNRDLRGYFFPPDPLVVIRDSNDAAKRAEAFAALQEPKKAGGNEREQQHFLQLLEETATKDREPITRLAAVRRLGKVNDPRAVQILQKILFQKLDFPPEMNSRIRQESLRSLAETGNPQAVDPLVRIARQPGVSKDDTLSDQQMARDERLVALRGLAKFPQPAVHEVLIDIMSKEKDVAIRTRAHRSLKESTGRNLPDDPKEWRESLQRNPNVTQPSVIERAMFWKR